MINKNTDRNKLEFTQRGESRLRSLSEGATVKREVKISLNTESRVKQVHSFDKIYHCRILQDIVEQCMELEDGFYQVLVDLKRTDWFFYSFIEGFVVEFLKKFKEPFLANRFDLLKWPNRNVLPDYFTTDLKKAVTLYSLVANHGYPECLNYKAVFEKYLDDCMFLWQKSGTYFSRSECENADISYNLDCAGNELVLNSNDRQQSYLLSRLLERYFPIYMRFWFLDRFLTGKALDFINFLTRYQSFGNVSRLLNFLLFDLCQLCESLEYSKQKQAMRFLTAFAEAKCISETFQQQLLECVADQLVILIKSLSIHKEDFAEVSLAFFVSIAKVNPSNIERIIAIFRKLDLQEDECQFLIYCAKEQLITEKFAKKLMPRIIGVLSEFSVSMKNSYYLDVLSSFINRNLISEEVAMEIMSLITSMICNLECNCKVRKKALLILGDFAKANLISPDLLVKQLPIVLASMVHFKDCSNNPPLRVVSILIRHEFLTIETAEAQVPTILLMINDSREYMQHSGLICLEKLVCAKLTPNFAVEDLGSLVMRMLCHSNADLQKSAWDFLYKLIENKLVSEEFLKEKVSPFISNLRLETSYSVTGFLNFRDNELISTEGAQECLKDFELQIPKRVDSSFLWDGIFAIGKNVIMMMLFMYVLARAGITQIGS